jgi:selenoprotein W-related protein
LRAAWLAQELLTTFEQDLVSVALKPGSNGIFEIMLNQQLIFSRKDEGRFPEAKEVKQLVRDLIDPARDLGHSDRPSS